VVTCKDASLGVDFSGASGAEALIVGLNVDFAYDKVPPGQGEVVPPEQLDLNGLWAGSGDKVEVVHEGDMAKGIQRGKHGWEVLESPIEGYTWKSWYVWRKGNQIKRKLYLPATISKDGNVMTMSNGTVWYRGGDKKYKPQKVPWNQDGDRIWRLDKLQEDVDFKLPGGKVAIVAFCGDEEPRKVSREGDALVVGKQRITVENGNLIFASFGD